MAADILTMMAVHAHPDDEASSTGGVLALYADHNAAVVSPGKCGPGQTLGN